MVAHLPGGKDDKRFRGAGVMRASTYRLRRGAGEHAAEGKKLLLFRAAVPASVELLMTRFIRFQSHLQQKPKTPPTACNSHSGAEPYMTPKTVKTTDELCLCLYVFHVGLITEVWEMSASIIPLTLPFC